MGRRSSAHDKSGNKGSKCSGVQRCQNTHTDTLMHCSADILRSTPSVVRPLIWTTSTALRWNQNSAAPRNISLAFGKHAVLREGKIFHYTSMVPSSARSSWVRWRPGRHNHDRMPAVSAMLYQVQVSAPTTHTQDAMVHAIIVPCQDLKNRFERSLACHVARILRRTSNTLGKPPLERRHLGHGRSRGKFSQRAARHERCVKSRLDGPYTIKHSVSFKTFVANRLAPILSMSDEVATVLSDIYRSFGLVPQRKLFYYFATITGMKACWELVHRSRKVPGFARRQFTASAFPIPGLVRTCLFGTPSTGCTRVAASTRFRTDRTH